MYINFSDAAKFADIARNIAEGRGWGANFNFFDPQFLNTSQNALFPASYTPPAMPYVMALSFKIFGISDIAVIATSVLFFVLTVIFTYLLANKLFDKFTALLSSLAVVSTQAFWDYAGTGASETLFMFEIVAIPYFILFKKTWATVISLFLMVAMYFTRPQAVVFIPVYVLFWLLLKFEFNKVFFISGILLITGLIIDSVFLLPLSGTGHFYSITGRALQAITQQGQNVAASDALRGLSNQTVTILSVFKKAANNLFNFYRLIPNIMSPYLFFLFPLSLFFRDKDRDKNAFKIVTVLAALLSFLLPALTIPFIRYIHPVVPLVYIISTSFLVDIINKLSGKKSGTWISVSVIMFFVVFLNIGTAAQDYRFNKARTNPGKAPVYEKLAEILKDNTQQPDFIITNLDTWGSWYGERKTMWFPLEPKQLIDPATNTVYRNIDAIYLTSYLINDENYLMNDNWRQIFNNPENPDIWTCDGCDKVSQEFSLRGEYKIPASEDYQKEEASSILLVRK